MTTALIGHPAALAHDMGAGHPERPDRLRVVNDVLAGPSFSALRRLEAPEADRSALLRVHPERFVDALLQVRPSERQLIRLDADTAIGFGTVPAALRGAGGAVKAVDDVLEKRAANAFVAMRPPGHHAERQTAMGFCFQPDLVILSSGFDAHRRDPLGGLDLDERDFAWATRRVMALAADCAGGRVVSLLEGGYDLEGLSLSVAAHVTALMEGSQ